MSFDKHLEREGVQLADNNHLPPGQRQQKVFRRVIAAVRAAEAESNDQLQDANERCRIAQDKVSVLMEEVQKLKAELLRLQIQSRLDEDSYQKLTTADKTRLLEVVPS